MQFLPDQLLEDIPVAFVDTETTGASVKWGDRIIEVGIVRVEHGQVVGSYQQLVDPGRRIAPGISVLTGITQDMVDGQPTFLQQLDSMMPFLSGALVVGHNVRFDLSFLHAEFRRCRLELARELGEPPVGDTLRIARRRFGRGGNSLGMLAAKLGVPPVVAHRALADAQTTAGVFERLLEPMGGYRCTLKGLLSQQGGHLDVQPASTEQPVLPAELEMALGEGVPVRMEYLDASSHRTIRVVRPLRIHRLKDGLVLVAYCHLRQAQRTFKLDRIVRFEPYEG